MHNLSILYHLLILQSLAIYYLYRIVPFYLPFTEVHTPLRVSEVSSDIILYITSPLY